MPSQFFGLNIGMSALSAFQASISTTANNIANVQTEGYSRQNTTLESTAALRVYATYGSTGTGVAATEIKQERDLYYDTKYWENQASLGYFEQTLYYLEQIETTFADDGIQEGFSTIFNTVFNSLDTLNGDNASDESVRNQFIHDAQTLCTYFNSVSGALTEMQKDCNEEILNATKQINVIAEKISLVNKEINRLELNGGYANELRDQRALLIDELSSIVNVETKEYEVKNTYGENLGGTNYLVMINGQVLVDGNEYRTLQCNSSDYRLNQTDAEGMYSIVWSDTGADFAATTESASGSLKALFDLRDGNNGENMKGTAEPLKQDSEGTYTTLTMTGLSTTNINALNIPAQGVIKINNNYLVYDSWEANLDAEGKITDITFHFEDAIDPLTAESLGGFTAEVGKSVDSMGIPYYQNQMSEFLRNFTEMFNDIQKQGETLDGEKMGAFFVGETGTGVEFNLDAWGLRDENGSEVTEPTKITSHGDSYYQITAATVKVNNTSLKDPRYFATAKGITNGEDAVDLLDDLQALQEDVPMYRGANAGAFLEVLLSDIAVDVEKTEIYYKNYFNMNTVIDNQRLSVFGVDEDEEALNLVKFQNAYNMSSKIVSVFSEIYNKLINETGVT
uniref:flagellar hook-associated protein FlgK n=1 Tax=Agathobacter sp. TaxID=2021311 RepID=UPI004057977D